MPKGDVVLASFVIIAVLLAPIGLAYVCDQMRTYTQDVVVAEAADYITNVEVCAKNSSGVVGYPDQSYVITDDKYVLVPSISKEPNPTMTDIAELFEFTLWFNQSEINGKWLWDKGITKVVVCFEGSKAISKSLSLHIGIKDADGTIHDFDVADYTPNASAFTFVWEPTTIQLAQLEPYDNTIQQFAMTLKSTDNTDLGYREGDYFAIRITFYTAQNPFSQEQIDILLLASGIVMLMCAAFATPYINLKQLEALHGRRG